MGCNPGKQGRIGKKALKETVYNTKDHNTWWRWYGYLWTKHQRNSLYKVETTGKAEEIDRKPLKVSNYHPQCNRNQLDEKKIKAKEELSNIM